MNRSGPIIVLLVGLLLSACSGGSKSTSTNAPPPSAPSPVAAVPSPSPSPQTEFEKDLQFIRNGGYTYVYIFSRKDGKPLEPTDSTFLRTNAPQIVDWAKTDGGKKVIAGTNFNLEEGNLAALKKRYNVEDYSGK
jgi:hypothetical protein